MTYKEYKRKSKKIFKKIQLEKQDQAKLRRMMLDKMQQKKLKNLKEKISKVLTPEEIYQRRIAMKVDMTEIILEHGVRLT